MIGILAEKPSAARNFAKALRGSASGGTFNGEQYIIVAARGHLYEFKDPSQMVPPALSAQYKDWDIGFLPWNEKDFTWERVPKKETKDLLHDIKKQLDKCDEVCIATDVDPTGEGELLAWEILDALDIKPKKFSRMYFADESEKEVQKAFINRKLIPSMLQDMDYVKANYRSQWDLLSMQFTRLATHCVGGGVVLRQGRLKSVMVKIAGDGLQAYNNYKKVTRYQNKFRDENGVIYTNPEEPIYDKKEDVPTNIYHTSEVVCDKKEMKKQAPPKLVDLASLASTLATRGFKAKEVQDTYQKMYEQNIVSYPRTEDKFISPEQFNDLLPLVDKIAAVVKVDTSLLTHRTPRSTHVKSGGAHGANRPGTTVPKSLAGLVTYGQCAPDIYDILAKNTLAMFAEDYEYESQKGHVKDYPKFTGTAAVPKFAGWKAVYNDIDADADDDDTAKGLGTMADPYIADIVNPRPPRPTMKWLMKQLERHDVGTGATRNSTYAEITNDKSDKSLMKDKKGTIDLTECGQLSYILIQGTKIADVEVTEALMAEMRDIASGKAQPDVCLAKVKDMVLHDRDVMLANIPNLQQLDADILKKYQRTSGAPKERCAGKWNGNDIMFTREWSGHRFTDEECQKLLNDETIDIMDCVSAKTGATFNVRGKLENQTYNGRKFVGFKVLEFLDKDGQSSNRDVCTGKWKRKEVTFNREWCGHRFTDDECERLLKDEEIELTDCVSKDGKQFSCRGKLENQTYNGRKFVGFKMSMNKQGPPKEWCQHEFTDAEMKSLKAGKEIFVQGLVSKTNSVFSAYLSYGKTKDGRMGINMRFKDKK